MKKFIFSSLFLLLFVSCSNKKWLNTNIDNNFLPQKPSVKDDFYQSVNYDKISIPMQENCFFDGMNGDTDNIITNQMLSFFMNNKKSDDPEEQLLIDLFNLYLDWEKRNSNGLKAVLPSIEKVQSVKTIEDFKNLYKDQIVSYYMPVSLFVESYTVCIGATKVFQNSDSSFNFYSAMMEKAGYSQSESKRLLENAAAFEKQVFAEKETQTLYINFNDVDSYLPKLSLKNFVESQNLVLNGKIYSSCYDTLLKFNDCYNDENIEELKTLCICNLLFYSSKLSDKDSYDLYLDYYNSLYGKTKFINYETCAVDYLNANLPMLYGKVWLKNFFSEDLKKDVTGLTNTILNEYKNIINNWEWISESTRYNELSLLNNMILKIGYDTDFEYEPEFDFFENDLLNTAFSIHKHKIYKDSAKYWDLYDNEKWLEPPQTVNANYYMSNFAIGVINVYAGYIIATEYSSDLSIEEKFARLGVTIAHEISHSFSIYNSFGEISNLWKTEDIDVLNNKLSVVSKYLNTIEVVDGKKCNGDKVICEMGAELFGMYAILNIAQQYSDFNYDLFFKTYARQQYYKTTKEYVSYMNDYYTLPMGYLRVNVILQQFDEFYKTYNVNPADKMYLSPKKRIIFSENYNNLIPFTNYNYSLEIDELNLNTLPHKLFSNSFYDMDLFADKNIYSACKVEILDSQNKILNSQTIFSDIDNVSNLFKEKIYTDINSSKMVISLKSKGEEEFKQLKTFDLIPPHLKETKLVNYNPETKITTFNIDITNIHSFPKELKPGRVYTFDIDLKDFDFTNCRCEISYNKGANSIFDDFILQSNGHFVKTVLISESVNSISIRFDNSYWFDSYVPIYAEVDKENGVDKIKIPANYKNAQKYLHDHPDERIISYLQQMNIKELCKINPDKAILNCVNEINKIASCDYEKIVLINDCICFLVNIDEDDKTEITEKSQDYRSVLKNGSAMNEGFAHLFYQMCFVAKIPCFEIKGYGLEIFEEQGDFIKDFKTNNQNYMWNVVMADGYWYHADIFANGCGINKDSKQKYYSSNSLFQKPKSFLLVHYPLIPEYQLLSKPVNDKQYVSYVNRTIFRNHSK